MSNKNIIYISSGILIIAIFAALAFYFKGSQQSQYNFLMEQKSEVFVRSHAPRYGNPDAKVFLVEFLDPECESCRAFYPEVKKLLKEFDDKVQLVVRYAPFHGNSQIAIRALEAARLQNKYWESLEILFSSQPKWGSHHHPRPELIFDYLSRLGLDMDKLREDMKRFDISSIIEQDMKDLRELNVRRTPTFFVNGKKLERFGVDPLRELIKDEIRAAYE